MPGPIQSVERAAAVLRAIGSAGRPLELSEIAQALDLPKATAHGIARTLKQVGFLSQHGASSAYTLGEGLRSLGHVGLDPHDLRSLTTNYADALAARTRLQVLLGVPDEDGVRIVHHVFRPDGSAQTLRIDEVVPYHATALGKAALAFAPSLAQRTAPLDRYTHRTVRTRSQLGSVLEGVRTDGYAVELTEHDPDLGAIAAPLRTFGGLGIGAVGVVGPVETVFDRGSRPHGDLVRETQKIAAAMSRAITTPR